MPKSRANIIHHQRCGKNLFWRHEKLWLVGFYHRHRPTDSKFL